MIALIILKVQVMLYTLILPYSYYREDSGIYNNSTEDIRGTGLVI